MQDYTPCYRLDLRDWLDSIERKPDAQHCVGQCSDSAVDEKPRPSVVNNITVWRHLKTPMQNHNRGSLLNLGNIANRPRPALKHVGGSKWHPFR